MLKLSRYLVALFVLTIAAGCLDDEAAPTFYLKPFYAYGGISGTDKRWVFVIDHRNDYFAADRVADTGDDSEDEADDTASLHIEGSFDLYDNGFMELKINKTGDENDISTGLVLEAYYVENQAIYILPNADGADFSEGFYGVLVSDCQAADGYDTITGQQNAGTYTHAWLPVTLDADTSNDAQWGQLRLAEEDNATILAVIQLGLSQGDTGGFGLTEDQTYYRTELTQADIDNDSPSASTQTAFSVCLLGDLTTAQIPQSVIDTNLDADDDNNETIDDSSILSRYQFISPDGLVVSNTGVEKTVKAAFPSDDLDYPRIKNETYTGIFTRMDSANADDNTYFTISFGDDDTGTATALENPDSCSAGSATEDAKLEVEFTRPGDGVTVTGGQLEGVVRIGTDGDFSAATDLAFRGFGNRFNFASKRDFPAIDNVSGHLLVLSFEDASDVPYLLIMASDNCEN